MTSGALNLRFGLRGDGPPCNPVDGVELPRRAMVA
jgi:hypothetical protein